MTNTYKKYSMVILFCLIMVNLNTPAYCESEIRIKIDPNRNIGEVNPLIYGSSILGDGIYLSRSNYGGGIWDPVKNQSVREVIGLAREAGLSIIRYPGGGHTGFYDWKKTVGPLRLRPKYLYGLDEFLKTAEDIGCDVVYNLPYFTGTSQDAADLIEYLNAPFDGSNPGGGIDWAKERANNGHPDPYRVKYFELGNEVYSGFPKKDIPPVDPEVYGNDYIQYRNAMRAIDDTIQLGAVTINSGRSRGLSAWNERLFKKAGESIDFLIEHTYFDWLSRPVGRKNTEIYFTDVLENTSFVDNYYEKLSDHFKSVTGRSSIPLAITEYNSGFKQENPVPLRHSLGAALFNAALLQIFIKPEHDILMANYWQFVNDYWGMITNKHYLEGKDSYVKRPNYLVFEMFHKHFGSKLVDVIVQDTDSSIIANSDNILKDIKWKTKSFSGEDIEINDDEAEITFSGKRDVNFFHVRKKARVKPNTTYELSGKLRAEGLIDYEGVGLQVMDGRGWAATHSAIETGRIWGTTKWIDVSAEYTTLADASEILVIVRRLSGHGKIKGKIFVKDITLTEKTDSLPKGKDAVSVSASISGDGKTVYLMVLNKNVVDDIEAIVSLDNNKIAKVVDVWTLNGPNILATNEELSNNVTINNIKVNVIDQNNLTYSFPPHSLTSIKIMVR